eukprot:2410857-Alexandrium_andersonii.AAC.1
MHLHARSTGAPTSARSERTALPLRTLGVQAVVVATRLRLFFQPRGVHDLLRGRLLALVRGRGVRQRVRGVALGLLLRLEQLHDRPTSMAEVT